MDRPPDGYSPDPPDPSRVQPDYVVSFADAPRPLPLVDPDHFAVAEEDYDSDNVFDRLFRAVAARLGALTAEEDCEDQVLAERTRRWTTRTIAFAALTLLFLNAQSLRSWASTLQPSWASETLRLVSGDWADRLNALGLDEPRARLHGAYEAQKSRSWPRT